MSGFYRSALRGILNRYSGHRSEFDWPGDDEDDNETEREEEKQEEEETEERTEDGKD